MNFNRNKGHSADQDIRLLDLLGLLLRHRWAFLSGLVLGLVLVMAIAFWLPSQFRATSKVTISKPKASTPSLSMSIPSVLSGKSRFVETQIQILKSWPVLDAALESLDLTVEELMPSPPGVRSTLAWIQKQLQHFLKKKPTNPEADREKRMKDLAKLVKITRVPDADVVKIRATAGSPEKAQAFAAAIAKQAGQRSLTLKKRTLRRNTLSLANEVASTQENLIKSFQEVRDFEKKENATLLTSRVRTLATTWILGDIAMIEMKRSLQAVSAQIEPLKKQIASARKGITRTTTSAHGQLKQRLLNLRVERDRLASSFTEEHPSVRELDKKLRRLEKEYAAEQKALLAGNFGSQGEINQIQVRYQTLLQARAGLASRTESLKAKLEYLHKKINQEADLLSRYELLRHQAAVTQKIHGLLLARHQAAVLKESMAAPDFQLLEPPLPPHKKSFPRYSFALILGLIVGAGLGAWFSYRAYHRQSRVWPDGLRIQRGTELPLRTRLPRISAREEPYRTLAPEWCDGLSRLVQTSNGAHSHLLLSAGEKEGKSLIAIQFARFLASSGRRTLLLDANLRNPCLAKRLSLEGDPVSLLSLKDGLPEKLPTVVGFEDLSLLSGEISEEEDPPPPEVFLTSGIFLRAVEEISKRFDHLVIDTPALSIGPEGLLLSGQVDDILLLARARRTSVLDFEKSTDTLRQRGLRISSFLLNLG
jgi:uncharacterized protein involved in exopolysaccharide biosynthesis